jgi:hypothetical protein
MPRLFESFDYLNRDWDSRILEHQSLRSVFVWLVVVLILSGADAAIVSYGLFRHSRVDWPVVLNLVLFVVIASRSIRLIYRRLGH